MNALLFACWAASFLLALAALWKWMQRREWRRRMAKGLRAYADGAQVS